MVRHAGGAGGLCEGCRKPYPCPTILLEPLQRALDDHRSPFTEQFKAFTRDDVVLARCMACGEDVRAPEPVAPYRMLERQEQWRVTLSEHRERRGEGS